MDPLWHLTGRVDSLDYLIGRVELHFLETSIAIKLEEYIDGRTFRGTLYPAVNEVKSALAAPVGTRPQSEGPVISLLIEGMPELLIRDIEAALWRMGEMQLPKPRGLNHVRRESHNP